MNLTVHSVAAVADAIAITNDLKEENFRGVKVKQLQAEPKEGELDIAEYLPLIQLVVTSGAAAAFVTGLFGILKNGFFTESKKIASQERIEMAKIEAEKNKVEEAQRLAYLELILEHGDEKQVLKITEDNGEEQKEILNKLLAKITD